MKKDQNNTHIPPALRAAKPMRAAPKGNGAKRAAGGAIVSAALAGGGAFVAGPLAGLSGLSGLGSTGTAQAAPCAENDVVCLASEAGAELFGGGDGSLFGAGVGATADALAPFNLIGPGGLLIGNGLDAADDCTGAACDGGDGGLLFGNGGAGKNGGKGGRRLLDPGNGGAGGDIVGLERRGRRQDST